MLICFVVSPLLAQQQGWWNAVLANQAPQVPGTVIVTNFNDLIFNNLVNATSASSASTYATAAVIPATNSLVLVAVSSTKATAADTPSGVTNAGGIVFVQLTNTVFGTSSTNKLSVWYQQIANPTSGAITANFPASQTSCNIQVVELQGADTSIAGGAGALVQWTTNGAAAASANPFMTFSAPSAVGTNGLIAFVADNVNSTSGDVKVYTNWFPYTRAAHANPLQAIETLFQMNALNKTSLTNTATSRAWGMILVEVKPSLINDPTTQPVMVQHKSWNNVGNAGTPPNDDIGAINLARKLFTNYLSNVTLAGNMLFIHLAYDQTGDPSRKVSLISDNLGSTYTKLGGGANLTNQDVFENYILPNNPGGVQWFNINFSSGVSNDYHVEFGEFAHVALSSPLDVSSSSAPTALSMDYGSITSSIDGDLIIGCSLNVQNGSINGHTEVANQMYQGGGHFLSTQSHLVGCSGYFVQAKASQVDPLLFVSGLNTNDLYVSQCMAFKKGSGGTMRPTNIIYVARMQQEWIGTNTTMLIPFEGNLIVVADSDSVAAGSNRAWASFPASGSALWTIKATAKADGPQMGYLSNSIGTKGIPIQVTCGTVANNGGHSALPGFSYDVFYASAFPFDAYAEWDNAGAQSAQNAQIKGSTNNVTVSGDLVIDICTTGTGPFAPYITPQFSSFDSTWYPFSGDLNKLNQGTANGSYYSSNLTAVTFTLQFSNTISTSWDDNTFSFKNGAN